jgi:hypothetical protein
MSQPDFYQVIDEPKTAFSDLLGKKIRKTYKSGGTAFLYGRSIRTDCLNTSEFDGMD